MTRKKNRNNSQDQQGSSQKIKDSARLQNYSNWTEIQKLEWEEVMKGVFE